MGNLRHTPEELRTSAGKTDIIVFLMLQVVLKHYQGQEPLSQRVQKKPQRGIGGMRGKEKLLCPSQPKWLTVKANLLSAEWPGVCGCRVTSLDIRYPVYLSPRGKPPSGNLPAGPPPNCHSQLLLPLLGNAFFTSHLPWTMGVYLPWTSYWVYMCFSPLWVNMRTFPDTAVFYEALMGSFHFLLTDYVHL